MEEIQVNLMLQSGVRYTGTLKDGLFHNSGCLLFPDGGTYHGMWDNGVNISGTYRFPDGLPYKEEDWLYCSRRDRRFCSEICNGLQPGAQETNLQPTPELPYGHYDTGDGIYDPEENLIRDYRGDYLREPDEEEVDWIVKCCRRGIDEDVDGKAKEVLDELLSKVSQEADVEAALSNVITTITEYVEPAEDVVSHLVEEVVLNEQ